MKALEQAYDATQARGIHRQPDVRSRHRPGPRGRCAQPCRSAQLQATERGAAGACPRGSPGIASSIAGASDAEASSSRSDERSVDWATAEELAFASILADGIADPADRRGRASAARSATATPCSTTWRPAPSHVPLQRCRRRGRAFEIHNSPLSENATIGFEYGYNVQAPDRLVIWEAQYGDFINGAQVMLDEFVTSARAKWGQTPSLVLLLPHGYEGQGPDHSSARLERFLQLAADINLRVANCTTAAQYFHLLRRQALLLTTDPLPLVVLTPKSLLRHPSSRRRRASSRRALAAGDRR